MTTTLTLSINDTAIKRHVADPSVKELRDARYPLRLRYRQNRDKASWYLVQHRDGKSQWRKLGTWPLLSSKVLLPRLPELLAQLAVKPAGGISATGWHSMGELLRWYGDRMETDRQLSESRRRTVASAIQCHLLPAFDSTPIQRLTHDCVDRLFWLPLQGRYKLSTLKAWFAILKRATRLAATLKLIERDPLAAVTFGNFTTARIQPKVGKLRPSQVPLLLAGIPTDTPRTAALFLLMLLCGTRIGETRKAQRGHIDRQGWYIPPEHAKSRTEHQLPMTPALERVLAWWSHHSTGPFLLSEGVGCLSSATASALIRGISGREWTAHDLRKLARTCWADLGVDYMVGELLLNHTLSKLDQTYIHTHAETQKLAALTTYHQWLMDNGLAGLLDRLESKTEPRSN